MKKLYALLFLFASLFACKQKGSHTAVPPTEKQVEKFEKKIEKRPDFQTRKSVELSDTTVAGFANIIVNDHRFKERILKESREFYKRTDFKTRWIFNNNKNFLLESFLEVLSKSNQFGFNPETYAYNVLKTRYEKLKADQLTNEQMEQLDKQATASFLLFAIHLNEGRIYQPEFGKHIWRKAPAETDEVDLLAKLKNRDDLNVAVESLHPQHDQYKRMQKRLQEIREKKDSVQYEQFSFDSLKKFEEGYENDKILKLRQNLAFRGFPTDTLSNTVDENLLTQIKAFQEDRNITADGLPGRNTLYYLNMTPQQEEDLLILNMERVRWLNREKFGSEFVLVNIPEFKLYMFKNNELQFDMNVIVGDEFTPTPVFSDNIEYLEFRPTWTVPQSIIRGEMIPKMKSDPTRYTRRGFTIYEKGQVIDPTKVNWSSSSISKRYFTFVEKPSPSNALGLVKFIFPNDLSIYLHDTPTDHLFKEKERAMSHGCVRLEEPAKLAAFLLEDKPEWTLEKVEEAMNSGPEKQRVYLDKDVHVQLMYITAYVNENNKLIISNDVYGFDNEHLKILREEYGV